MDPSLIATALASKVQDCIDTHFSGHSYPVQLAAARSHLRQILVDRGRDPSTFYLRMNPGGPCYDGAYTVEVEPRSAVDQLADLV